LSSRLPKIYIIVLNFNQTETTIECLNSLNNLDYPCYQIVVVDNGSSQTDYRNIPGKFPDIIFIHNEENLGVAGGRNVGIKRAIEEKAEYILLLDNDMRVAPDLLCKLQKAITTESKIGIVEVKIYFYAPKDRIWCVGGSLDIKLGESRCIGRGEKDYGQYDDLTEIDYVSGGGSFVSCKFIEDIGLLDERFFYGFEDVDWSLRAKQAGYKLYFAPQAKVWHKHESALGRNSPKIVYHITRSRLLFMKKHSNPRTWIKFLLRWVPFHYFRNLIKRLIQNDKQTSKALFWGFIDFWLGNFERNSRTL